VRQESNLILPEHDDDDDDDEIGCEAKGWVHLAQVNVK